MPYLSECLQVFSDCMADGCLSSGLDSDLSGPGNRSSLDQCVFGQCTSTQTFHQPVKGHLDNDCILNNQLQIKPTDIMYEQFSFRESDYVT